MSVGDCFTLRLLNFLTKQALDTDLNGIKTRLTTLENKVNNNIDSVLEQSNNQINDIILTVQEFGNRITTLEGNVDYLVNKVAQLNQDIIGINLQLQQLQDLPNQVYNMQTQINNMNGIINGIQNMIGPLFGRINNLELLYKKIDEFTLTNLHFTNGTGMRAFRFEFY